MQGAVDPIQLKGSRHGILVSVREDVDFAVALEALAEKLGREGAFFAGGQLSLDLGWREVAEEEFARLEALLAQRQMVLLGIVSTSLNTRNRAEARGHKAIIGRLGLAQHQGRAIRREARTQAPEPAAPQATAPPGTDEEPTLLLRRTLRSGQQVRYAGNVIVMGDVNPGAAIEAEGDVVVLGSLRGQAHAGCSGQASAVVVAMGMHPTQLRIGDQIWHGDGKKKKDGGPMRASVNGAGIVVEPFGG